MSSEPNHGEAPDADLQSEEGRVRVWMEQIDKWIAAANRKRGGTATSVTTREGVGGDDQQQRIQEMTERLKDL